MRWLVDISKLYDYSNNRLFLPIIPGHGRVVGNYRQTCLQDLRDLALKARPCVAAEGEPDARASSKEDRSVKTMQF
jgi:hypothetical protein